MILKQGWINLYKPKNITSFKAINSIKKKFSINKIGHAGTLDPMAEGVLPIAIGKATKLIPYISNMNKEYEFSVTWGTQTTTDDADFSKLNALEEYSFLSPNPIKDRKPYPARVPSNIHIVNV